MRRLLLLCWLACTGCSVLFDPSKAPLVPCQSAQCPALANAAASCEADACVYSCAPNFFDDDADLAKAKSNGCEGICSAALAPDVLHALVGLPTGAIHWLWNPPASGAASYRLCTGPSLAQLTTCVPVACGSPRNGFGCSATTEGLPNNVRHYGRVQSVDRCGGFSAEAQAPTRGVTPIDGELLSLSNFTLDSPCATKTTLDAGVLRLTQNQLGCVGGLVFGDDEWQDFTLRAEMKIIDTKRYFFTAVAFHYPSSGQKERRALIALTDSGDTEVTVGLTSANNGSNDQLRATSIGPVFGGRWNSLEIASVGKDVSIALAPTDTTTPRPILRWRDNAVGAKGSGRFALALTTIGFEESAEFKNLTLSTFAEIPDAGTSNAQLDFSTSNLPAGVRVTPIGTPAVTMKECPAFPVAAACDAGCKPLAPSRCIEIAGTGFNQKASVAFDQPLGLDLTKPWRLSLKFAPTALASSQQILRTQSGKGSVLRGPASSWTGNLAAFGVDSSVSLLANTWNKVDFVFKESSYTLTVNGTSAVSNALFPPNADWDGHLGAFLLGGQDGNQGGGHGFWTDVEVVQPP